MHLAGATNVARFLMIEVLTVLNLCRLILTFLETTTAIGPSCECIEYDGFGYNKNGTFTSPDYPRPYEPNIECLLYTFTGSDSEVVEITFQHFELDDEKDSRNRCRDFVKTYQDIEGPGVNENTLWQHELCGIQDGRRFYSKSSALILEFHSDSSRNPHLDRGFIGEFRFIDKRQYITEGNPDKHTRCVYRISSAFEARKGKFFSPDFPYHYPSNTKCVYRFKGNENQRVRITFIEIDLKPVPNSACIDRNVTDAIFVYDGRYGDVRRRSRNRGRRKPRRLGHLLLNKREVPSLIGHYCGRQTSAMWKETVLSSGRNAYVVFHSGDNKRLEGRGFYAQYEFLDKDATLAPLHTNPPLFGSAGEGCHERTFSFDPDSQMAKTGAWVTGPDFNESAIGGPGYGENLYCVYRFQTSGNWRVQVIFDHFNLYLPPGALQNDPATKPSCDASNDHLVAHVDVKGKIMEVKRFCGTQTPPRLMSGDTQLELQFITHKRSRNHRLQDPTLAPGFKFKYRYVDNFGITTGRRDPSRVCGFIYNSSEISNGTIYSPNYPGFYPRNLDCHYEFHGDKNETVRVHFNYFDVEGYDPCLEETGSDYVLFSNFQTADMKNSRFCGNIPDKGNSMGKRGPGMQESEQNFFRMLFHSNDNFEATGFHASFQFIKRQSPAIQYVKQTGQSGSKRVPHSLFTLLIIYFGALALVRLKSISN